MVFYIRHIQTVFNKLNRAFNVLRVGICPRVAFSQN